MSNYPTRENPVATYRHLKETLDQAAERLANHTKEYADWAAKVREDPLQHDIPGILCGTDLDGLTNTVVVARRHFVAHEQTLKPEERRELGLPARPAWS